MICSIWKIEFLPTSGAPVVLLDYGDIMEGEPEFETAQSNASSSPIFHAYGSNFALGGAQNPSSWSRRRSYTSNATARTVGMLERQSFPWGQQGSIRVSIENGTVWDYAKSTLLSMTASYPTSARGGRLMMIYRAQLGKPKFTAGQLPAGTPAKWPYLTIDNAANWEDLNDDWQTISTL